MNSHSQGQGARNHVPALLTLIVALLVVGAVAQEIVRHAVQSLPALVCLLAAAANVRAVKWAAYAIYLFWIAIAVLIWLFLLDLAHVARGHYTATEIAMTIVFGVAGIYGLASGWRRSGKLGAAGAVAVFVIAFTVQTLTMMVSLKPLLAHDAEFCAAVAVPLLCDRVAR
jgi:hypothetical protein